ncbi:MAG: hypothetical protein QF415_07065 [Candidatus Undinarchaeales archaeon]|jgi:tRNA (pseudouridine54-N1)-methyltransferase|nr:hypothetical protein [Candidatus Undinarchaeales archaeon]MDP7494040.1 hypothetical protein [Candidatus Undinarchaeales archaeon]
MTRRFVLLSHAVTTPEFTLKDLAGSAKRMDVVCRAVQAALFLSHGIRTDTTLFAVLHGPPRPPVTVKLDGALLRKVHPNERVLGIFMQKALRAVATVPEGDWVESTPGIFVRRGGLAVLLDELGGRVCLMREGAPDLRGTKVPEDAVFVLGDYLDPEADWLTGLERRDPLYVSVGPRSVFASHAMVLVHNELDRSEGTDTRSDGK